jgi:hypothetical protein
MFFMGNYKKESLAAPTEYVEGSLIFLHANHGKGVITTLVPERQLYNFINSTEGTATIST